MILIGLLSGGDYSPGVQGCGPGVAHGLAKAGFGDTLVAATDEYVANCAQYGESTELSKVKESFLCGPDEESALRRFQHFLDGWREDIREELRTNKVGTTLSLAHIHFKLSAYSKLSQVN
jgi:holliday junction resolvase YEN1